jgi:UDP-N-acetylglucosamine 2-epimerase
VNIGPRQEGRDRGSNVVDVGYDRGEIAGAIRGQVEHGRYDSEPIYGDGSAGRQIAEILAKRELTIRKRMTY